MSEMRGEYIITEGTDATGKTTVANLLAQKAYEEGREVIRVDEPDSAYRYRPDRLEPLPLAPIAAEVRSVIKNGSLGRTALTNVHLFTAARVENWQSIIQPALERGAWVIGARNWLSTLVYQGYAEGYDRGKIIDITRESLGEAYMQPDHLYILDLNDEKERARRIAERGELENPDTFESRGVDFQQKLLDGYRDIARQRAISIVEASADRNTVAQTIWDDITQKRHEKE